MKYFQNILIKRNKQKTKVKNNKWYIFRSDVNSKLIRSHNVKFINFYLKGGGVRNYETPTACSFFKKKKKKKVDLKEPKGRFQLYFDVTDNLNRFWDVLITARLLAYLWPFFMILHERVNPYLEHDFVGAIVILAGQHLFVIMSNFTIIQ